MKKMIMLAVVLTMAASLYAGGNLEDLRPGTPIPSEYTSIQITLDTETMSVEQAYEITRIMVLLKFEDATADSVGDEEIIKRAGMGTVWLIVEPIMWQEALNLGMSHAQIHEIDEKIKRHEISDFAVEYLVRRRRGE